MEPDSPNSYQYYLMTPLQMKAGGGPGIQAIGDIPQTLPPSQLGEGHGNQLLPTAKMADVASAS